jgi:hypothetical protein
MGMKMIFTVLTKVWGIFTDNELETNLDCGSQDQSREKHRRELMG